MSDETAAAEPGRAAPDFARAACEAFWDTIGAGPHGQPEDAAWQWAAKADTRKAWEAAAQAAIDAANVPKLIVDIASPLTEADLADLRERFEEAIRTERPQVIPELGAVAYEAAENAPLRERVAELVTEGNQLRALIAEILARYEPHCGAPDCTGAVADADQAELTAWRQSAGITDAPQDNTPTRQET